MRGRLRLLLLGMAAAAAAAAVECARRGAWEPMAFSTKPKERLADTMDKRRPCVCWERGGGDAGSVDQ